jgi:hypothetical protein
MQQLMNMGRDVPRLFPRTSSGSTAPENLETSKHPRGGTEEGWKKMDGRKGKGKGGNKVGTRSAGGIPTWADIARASTSLYKRGRWLHQTDGTPAGRKGQEEAARALATRFFFDGRMKGKRGAHFFCLTFCLFLLSGRQMGRMRKGGAQKVASRLQAQDSVFFCPVYLGLLGLRSMYIWIYD